MPKREPCPFCGGTDLEVAESILSYFVVCMDSNCEAQGPRRYSLPESIKAWNKRAMTQVIVK